MLFNSFSFFFFFIAVWCVAKGFGRWFDSPRWRNLFLLAASWFFYGSFRLDFLLWLILVTVITYCFGRIMVACRPEWRRRLTGITITLSLLPLVFFKYTHFLCSALQELPWCSSFKLTQETENLILPVGISFFTFQALSYTIDLYRGKIEPEKNFITFALFVAFFPTVLSGPIEKARELLPQLNRKSCLNLESLAEGAHLFIWGLFKKIVVADRLASYVDLVYDNPAGFSGKTVAFAAICYSIQIYCDFSGYSDMAVGVGKALGFELNRNFDKPYFAVGIRDFWKRWHISLTGWFTEYLYFSCGGNRVSRLRWIGNIMLVFLTSGLWHGAGWNFLIWGGLHGILYLLEFALSRGQKLSLAGVFSRLAVGVITFAVVTVAWIFFRVPHLSDVVVMFKQMIFAWGRPFSVGPSSFSFTIMLLVCVFVMGIEFWQKIKERRSAVQISPLALRRLSFSVIMFWAVELLGVPGKQFVYFLF